MGFTREIVHIAPDIRYHHVALIRCPLTASSRLSQSQVRRRRTRRPAVKRAGTGTWHAKKAKRHTVMRGVCAAGLEEGAVVASEVVEARLVTQLEAWVEACSMRALLGSLLLGLAVRGWFTRVRVLPDGQEVFEEIPAELAVIPNLAERNMYLQLIRGLPPPGLQSRPSAAVVAVLAFYPGLHARLNAVPRYEHDSNTVNDVGTKLETNFANSLTELFTRRVEQGWTERQRSWVARSVQGEVVTWLEGQEQGQGGVVPTEAMRDEVARQRRLLGLGQGVVVDKAWLERGVNRGSLLRHAVDTSRQLEAAHVSWQLDWAVWQAAGGQANTRPYRPPSPFALTPGCSCMAHHIKLDTQALFGLMRTAGMLPADITSLPKFRSGVDGPKDSEVAAASVQRGEAFYDRDVSAALNIRRCAVGPGPRPTELCYWDGRPAMPKPGRPGQEWVYLRDKALLLSLFLSIGCQVVAFIKGTRQFPQCGFSNTVCQVSQGTHCHVVMVMMLQILTSMKVPYETVNILENERLRSGTHPCSSRTWEQASPASMKEYSQWPTFPQVYVGGEFVGGCDIMIQMFQSGELTELLEKEMLS
ncbi:hypothetical protein QJQ45_027679 [Haematococcus lacustris]|nr:hypothetical protein QJQ45_027679 [Haematococcus lacustris]